MNDRWDSSPDELRELIAAERSCPDPAQDVQARVLQRLSVSIGFAPGPSDMGVPSSAPLSQPQLTTGGGALARLAARVSRRGVATFLVGAAVGATAVGTVDRVRHRAIVHESPAVPLAAPAPAAPVPRPAPTLVPSTAPNDTPAVPLRRSAATATLAEAKDKGLEAERKLVEMARTALARGQTAGAVAALKRHQRSFPRGELAEERDSLWVSALVATGDYTEAREHASRFRRQYPRSLFAPMVEQAVQSIP